MTEGSYTVRQKGHSSSLHSYQGHSSSLRSYQGQSIHTAPLDHEQKKDIVLV